MERISFIEKCKKYYFESFVHELGMIPVYNNDHIGVSTDDMESFQLLSSELNYESAVNSLKFYLKLKPWPRTDPKGVELLFKSTQKICNYSWSSASKGFYYNGKFRILKNQNEMSKIDFAQSLMKEMIQVAKENMEMEFCDIFISMNNIIS